MSRYPQLSQPALLPRAEKIPGFDSPALYRLSDRLGLFMTGAAAGDGVRAQRPGGLGPAYFRQRPDLERALAETAFRGTFVPHSARFICDVCGLPVLTVAVEGGVARCPGCAE